ncbi:hydrophobic surface binding protein [Mycena metata]|uniref:Hydrophobic surface binding protein n=1 Tax=Mycena metata TaxID=1033252 RepID=A0AAD7HUP4_9AGAR|nr:hydrophobic surface binding protein [Mycena metata]
MSLTTTKSTHPTMVQFSRFLLSLSLLAVGLASPVKRTVAQVEADIASISAQVTTLDNNINAFPNTGGSLVAALAIHTDATSLETTLNQGTTDVKSTGTFDETDGNTILNSVEAFEPTILDALKGIAAKEPAFAALPIGGIPALILADLKTLRTDTAAFAQALIAAAPTDLKSEATTIANTIDAAFAAAIAVYS